LKQEIIVKENEKGWTKHLKRITKVSFLHSDFLLCSLTLFNSLIFFEFRMNDLNDNQLKNLIFESKEAAKKSYSPYSNYPVGASLLLDNGLIIQGC